MDQEDRRLNTLAATFPPGEFLREELEARRWSQTEFAEIVGRPVRLINELIAGKKAITPETAVQIGSALGTGPEVWMNLESQYQLSKVKTSDGQVAQRAKLYELFPVREMLKRGWIRGSAKQVDALQVEVLSFFGLQSIDEEPAFRHAAKKTHAHQQTTMLQYTWLYRAEQVASEMVLPPYSRKALAGALPRLAALLVAPEEVRRVAPILGECGVRFVVVEPIPGSKIDGACFWLDGEQPVVAMSLRLDRIDNFWFVLRHELEHVLQGHGKDAYVLDSDLDGSREALGEEEVVANDAAEEFCVSQKELTGFIARVGPFFAEERVILFAERLRIHPGLVAGQLQRRLGRYDLFRKHQVKVRSIVTASTTTDGWGVVHSV